MKTICRSSITGNVGMLLQNAADLTLTDMVLNTTGTAIYNGPDRALTVWRSFLLQPFTSVTCRARRKIETGNSKEVKTA